VELPAPLRQAVDRTLETVALAELRRASAILSERYRAETRDGRLHMADDLAAKAYLAARLPATYAAARASLGALAQAWPGFSPRTLLDIGAGPGTVLWAAADLWPGLERATMVEASAAARRIGAALAADHLPAPAQWLAGDATLDLDAAPAADLVTLAYVLDELAPAAIHRLIERLWALATDTLVVVEPGSPAGWRRILDVRTQLIAAGGHVLAPCPHDAACPLAAPDWCHFSRRVARSRIHRLTKNADVPWEDEKFIYLAVSRNFAAPRPARVLAPPRAGSGKVELKLCQPDGSATSRLFTKRDGEAFKAARRADWGGSIEA
jgi:ribosomal protein RSM22 (predicted rRNA methylase)